MTASVVTRENTGGYFKSVSEDHVFDLLAILVFIVLPFALACLGLSLAVRSSSVFWPVVGYALAVIGTWVSLVVTFSVAQCPSQDGEVCGDKSGVTGDVAAQLVVVLAFTYAVLIIWWRREHRRESS
jgi:hypothetical protein